MVVFGMLVGRLWIALAEVGVLGAGVLGNSRLRETARPLFTALAAQGRFSHVILFLVPF